MIWYYDVKLLVEFFDESASSKITPKLHMLWSNGQINDGGGRENQNHKEPFLVKKEHFIPFLGVNIRQMFKNSIKSRITVAMCDIYSVLRKIGKH